MLLFGHPVGSNSLQPQERSTPNSLSLTISWSLPKFMFIASVMPSSHLILWCPLLLLPLFFFFLISLFFGLPSHLGHHRALSRGPCDIQQVLITYLFYTECDMSISISQFIPHITFFFNLLKNYLFIHWLHWVFSCSIWDLVPWPGIENPDPLRWERRVLVKEPPGKSSHIT